MSSTAQIKKNFVVPINCESTFSKLQSVVSTLGLKNLKTKKTIPYSYLLVEYKEGFMQKGEIEFSLAAKKNKTEVCLIWTHPSDEEEESDNEGDFEDGTEIISMVLSNVMKFRKSTLNYDKLIEEIRVKINGLANFSGDEASTSEVPPLTPVVNIRCRACLEIFDERLGKCPLCGVVG